MTQEEEEIGRFKPKGDPFRGPREPFLPDNMLEPNHKPKVPSIEGLHLPKAPLTKSSLSTFLEELKPILESISEMKRSDQHLVATELQEVKKMLSAGDFSGEVIQAFDQVTGHFSKLLTHSTPIDRETVLEDVEQLLKLIKL